MYESTETDVQQKPGAVKYLVPVLAAILFGSLVGAGAMMLYAPRSGKETRKQINKSTRELRDKAVGGVRQAVKNTASRSRKIGRNTKKRVNSLQEQGREQIADRLGKVASGVKAAQKAIEP